MVKNVTLGLKCIGTSISGPEGTLLVLLNIGPEGQCLRHSRDILTFLNFVMI